MAGPVGGVDYPRTWAEFAAWFPDEAACGAYLERLRWGDGFICPGCGWDGSWAASRGLGSRVCAHCAKRTSITAGTVFAGTRIPLTQWFAAEERNQGLLDHPYNKQMGDAPNGPYGDGPGGRTGAGRLSKYPELSRDAVAVVLDEGRSIAARAARSGRTAARPWSNSAFCSDPVWWSPAGESDQACPMLRILPFARSRARTKRVRGGDLPRERRTRQHGGRRRVEGCRSRQASRPGRTSGGLMALVRSHPDRYVGSAADDAPRRPVAGAVLGAVWRSALPTATEMRGARRRLHAKAVAIAAVVLGGYWGLVIADSDPRVRVACAATLVTGLVAVATSIMHDANHGAFSRRDWANRLLGYTSDALGASSWLWRFKHNNLHHANTNVVGVDSDISQAPFARLAAAQPWRPWHRFQHLYLWFLYGFMGLKNVVIGDLRNLMTARIGDQKLRQRPGSRVVIGLVVGKFVHFGWAVVVPLLFNPWWKVIVVYVGCSWVVGFVLAVTFQLAHCVDAAEFTGADAARRGDDFMAHQVLTTVDVASPVPVVGHVFRWLVGGLDHQIEHHLAPRLPHTAYPLVARRFRRGCLDIGVHYRLHHGIWSSLRSHARWLKAMGQPNPPRRDPLVAGS